MARSKSDISNSAIRVFLQGVGTFYDRERGFESFRPTVKQKDQLLEYFRGRCCFCNIENLATSVAHFCIAVLSPHCAKQRGLFYAMRQVC